MSHSVDSRHAGHLENPLRKLLRPARAVLNRIGLAYGEVFLDVGAGTGYYAFPASSLVGIGGTVLAVDSDYRMIDLLRKRADGTKVLNVRIIRSEGTSFFLPAGFRALSRASALPRLRLRPR